MSFATTTHTAAEIAAMSNTDIIARADAITTYFDEYAAPAEGDIRNGLATGWDWPTMNVVFPELCAECRALRDEAKKRDDAGTWTTDNPTE